MAYRYGNREQMGLFPQSIEEYVTQEDPVRVYDAFVESLDFSELGIELDEGQVGNSEYDPQAMLKLLVYGYSYGLKGSRKLERACYHNVSFMWLMGGLKPDHKTIAEFRRMHREGVTAAGAELVRLARSVGLVKGEWVAIDGSKFQAVSSAKSVREREALERYLEQLEQSDEQDEVVIDSSAVAS